MSDQAIDLSDDNFDAEVLNSDVAVLVDFWAVDADAHPAILSRFGIRGIPTLIVFKGGEPVATKTGALSKLQLTEYVDGVV
ncbi:thiol reductase thioredoxin [Seongchinamella sediminis]|uniref:Thiol reductase thioredoxin n=1 Tax=Seongchinamella sediminis TaxID=2283635 RepID=A0A3L7DTL1_9GAMM|nr:thioredoxin domain-containing protein [Seongchinamella sediminis]RLQ20714.1 thiol reductase thioredoxin [Seongchinamella sediminis]